MVTSANSYSSESFQRALEIYHPHSHHPERVEKEFQYARKFGVTVWFEEIQLSGDRHHLETSEGKMAAGVSSRLDNMVVTCSKLDGDGIAAEMC
jgi:hypothetical protein